jgi:predicted NBD/HSP70 family sugar kinase
LPTPSFVIGIGLSLPAPIDAKAGRVMGPSILRGWDGFDLIAWLDAELGIPAIIENDVNVMTVFEASRLSAPTDHFLFVKMGTGIGSGFIADGRLYHGATGASGDIGHIQLVRDSAPLCRCGKIGCLEAHAAGWAIARDLRAMGIAANDAHDVVELVRNHIPQAIGLVREAGRTLGEVIADAISILNPRVLRIGGTLVGAHEYLLAGVRELVYQRCLPLATNDLLIEASQPDEECCVIGVSQILVDRIFNHDGLELLVGRHQQWRHSHSRQMPNQAPETISAHAPNEHL